MALSFLLSLTLGLTACSPAPTGAGGAADADTGESPPGDSFVFGGKDGTTPGELPGEGDEGGTDSPEDTAAETPNGPLCRPCMTSADCSIGGINGACVGFGQEGAFCGIPCDPGCPVGYECGTILSSVEGDPVSQCVPLGGALCECTVDAVEGAYETVCQIQNPFGTCSGTRSCTNNGLSACSAQTPAAEVCGGGDEDCDGDLDEPLSEGCQSYYKDKDDDGYGTEDKGPCVCNPTGDFTATEPGDCDDDDPFAKPSCEGKACGEDGCGGVCGTCNAGEICNDLFQCQGCKPDCAGKACGDDGCGGSCGDCVGDESCVGGQCEGCAPDCELKECGDDGCGGDCGTCAADETCTPKGQCLGGCVADCAGKTCGDDGCGGSCGTCGLAESCTPAGECVPDILPTGDGDTCEDAFPVDALPFVYAGETTDASADYGYGSGECPPEAGGWGMGALDEAFVLTSAAGGEYTATLDADYDSNLYVVSDCADVGGTCVVGDEDIGTGEEVTFSLAAGQTVFIIVDGFSNTSAQSGNYTLTVTETGGCVPDCAGKACGEDGCGGDCGPCESGLTCDAAGACVPVGGGDGDTCATAFPVGALPFSATGDTSDATGDYGYDSGDCPPESGGWGAAALDEAYALTAPATGTYLITLDADFDSNLYVVADCANPGGSCLAGDEDIGSGEDLSVSLTAGQMVFVIVDGFSNTTAQGGIYTLTIALEGGCVPDCAGKACGDNGCGGSCGDCGAGEVCKDSGACVPEGTGGAGDTCGTAFTVGALPFTAEGDTSDASPDYGYDSGVCPPETGGWGQGANDEVYAFTAPSTGSYAVTLTGSFDTNLYVITDCADPSGSCLAGDEDACTGCTEELAVTLTAGQAVYVIVDGWSNSSPGGGTYTLTISLEGGCVPDCAGKACGDNGCGGSCGECGAGDVCNDGGACVPESTGGEGDTCETAFTVGALPFTAEGDTSDASPDYGYDSGVCPPETGGWGKGANDEVYAFTAPSTGPYDVTLTGAFDSNLYVIADCADPSGSCLAGDEDACTGCTEELTVALTAGQTVYVVVDGWSNTSPGGGTYTLTIEAATPVCIPSCDAKVCGDDGCGGLCGECSSGLVCEGGACVPDGPVGGEGDTCEKAFVVGALPYSFDGDNSDATPNYGYATGQCPPETGGYGMGAKDEAFLFTAPATGDYAIALTASYDSNLYVVSDCANVGGTCLAGDEDICTNCTEDVTVSLTAGQIVYVIVDGYSNSSEQGGTYTLTIESTTPVCVPDCGGKACGDDGCGGSCGTCAADETCNAAGACIPDVPVGGDGDTCENPFVVGALPYSFDGDNSDATQNYGYASGECAPETGGWGMGAKDEAFLFTAPSTGDYAIALTAAYDSNLYVVSDCANVGGTCLAGDEDICTNCTEDVTVSLAAGQTVYVIVDGYSNTSEQGGTYTLTIEAATPVCVPDCAGKACGADGCGGSCGTCAAGETCNAAGACIPDVPVGGDGDTCEEAFVVGSLPYSFDGDNSDATQNYGYASGECAPETGGWGMGAKDEAFLFTAPATGDYAIALTATYDSNLYVVSDCANVGGTCLAGDEDICTNCTEDVTVSLAAGQTVYVIVDGYSNSSAQGGTYTLTIDAAGGTCTPGCTGKACGSDGCGGSCGTCSGGQTCDAAGQCVGGAPTNMVPTSCAEAHGLVGCCAPDNGVYWFEGGALQGAADNCGDNPCGWDTANGYYSCGGDGFTGADPSGTYPLECGLPNPAPGQCP